MLDGETRLVRNGDIHYAPVGPDDAVMVSLAAGRYYGLNAVARRLWELLERPQTLVELRDHVCAEFEVDAQRCEADLLPFMEKLREKGMVRVAEPGGLSTA